MKATIPDGIAEHLKVIEGDKLQWIRIFDNMVIVKRKPNQKDDEQPLLEKVE